MSEHTELLPAQMVRQQKRVAGNLGEGIFALQVNGAAEPPIIHKDETKPLEVECRQHRGKHGPIAQPAV
jgi:hypothetical protein